MVNSCRTDKAKINRGAAVCIILAAVVAFLSASPAAAQINGATIPVRTQPPDCWFSFGPLTAAVDGFSYDNRGTGCTEWDLTYNSQGFSALSLLLQSAPAAASNLPGVWANFLGTIGSGINPNTATTKGETRWTSSYNPWVRISLTSKTGTGSIYGLVLGWRARPAFVATISGNVPVIGPTAAGSAPTTAPVLIAGQDGAPGLIRTLETDSTGRLIGVGAAATGAAPAGAPVYTGQLDLAGVVRPLRVDTTGAGIPAGASATFNADGLSTTQPTPTVTANGSSASNPLYGVFPYWFNGSTWDRQFGCTNQALFNLSGSGDTQIIAASGSTVIRICHIFWSTTAIEDVKFTSGTGSNCGTGTADASGLMKSVQSFDFEFSAAGAFRFPAGAAACMNQSAAQAGGGLVVYARF